jgi:hypothetical protein
LRAQVGAEVFDILNLYVAGMGQCRNRRTAIHPPANLETFQWKGHHRPVSFLYAPVAHCASCELEVSSTDA